MSSLASSRDRRRAQREAPSIVHPESNFEFGYISQNVGATNGSLWKGELGMFQCEICHRKASFGGRGAGSVGCEPTRCKATG